MTYVNCNNSVVASFARYFARMFQNSKLISVLCSFSVVKALDFELILAYVKSI